MRYPVAFTWFQPELWDWAADPGPGLQVETKPVGEGTPWPKAPSDWRPGHRVFNVSLLPPDDNVLTFGWGWPGFELDGMMRWRTPRPVVEALVRRALQSTVGGQELFDVMWPDILRSENQVDRAYTIYRWPYGEPDRVEEPVLPTDPQLAFDAAGLASIGDWRLEMLSPGFGSFVHDDWHVKVELATRKISDGMVFLKVDAGGFVQGPGVDRELTEDEQLDETARRLQAWGAPAPTFRGLAMKVAWPDPWGPGDSIRRGLGSDRWGGPGIW